MIDCLDTINRLDTIDCLDTIDYLDTINRLDAIDCLNMIGCLIVYDLSMTRVTGISPSGENERGLMFIGRCNLFLPLWKVRMGLRTRGG